MEVSAANVGAIRVLQVRGRLDHSQAKDFEAALAPHLTACTPEGSPLVLDFSGVVYISSVGLRVLLRGRSAVSLCGSHTSSSLVCVLRFDALVSARA